MVDIETEIRRINWSTLEQASNFGGAFCGDAFEVAANQLGRPTDIVRSGNHGDRECAATICELVGTMEEVVEMLVVDMIRELL